MIRFHKIYYFRCWFTINYEFVKGHKLELWTWEGRCASSSCQLSLRRSMVANTKLDPTFGCRMNEECITSCHVEWDYLLNFDFSHLGSINIINRGGGLYDHPIRKRFFTLILIKMFIRALKIIIKQAVAMI